MARHFLYDLLVLLACIATTGLIHAESLHFGSSEQQSSFLVQIEAHTSSELSEILHRIEAFVQSESQYPSSKPFALVLHGDEANVFLRKNYHKNQEIVDLAAKLEAFNAIDIQICEYWMASSSVTRADLPAFVDTVPYGPDREDALLDEGYEYF